MSNLPPHSHRKSKTIFQHRAFTENELAEPGKGWLFLNKPILVLLRAMVYIFKCNHQDPELMTEDYNKDTAVVCISTADGWLWSTVSETLSMRKRRERRHLNSFLR